MADAALAIQPVTLNAGVETQLWLWVERGLTSPRPYGRDYAVCTTLQWDFKSSQNSVALTVEAPKTDVNVSEPASPEDDVTVTQTPETTTVAIPPAKTPEQIQQDAGVQVWGPDSWSILPPFFKLHAKVAIQSLGMVIQIWGGLFAIGVDSFTGLGTLLLEALKDLSPAAIDVAVSAMISVITAVYILYWSSIILASFTAVTVMSYIGTFLYYSGSILGTIAGSYLVQDIWLSKALLYGIGFTLAGLILGAFWNDPQARVFPAWLKQQIVGGDPVMNGAKSIINFYLTSAATISSLLSASIIFKNPLMWPFAITTLALAAFAIYAGTQR